MPGFPTSAADLEDYKNVTPEAALRQATNRLVAELGWDPRRSVRTLAVTGQRVVFLPAMNVTDVGVDPVAPGYAVTGAGVLRFPFPYTGTITYTAGWADADLPPVLSDVILQWAAEWMDNPRRLRQWNTGAEGETYAVVAGANPGGDERLDPYRLMGGIA